MQESSAHKPTESRVVQLQPKYFSSTKFTKNPIYQHSGNKLFTNRFMLEPLFNVFVLWFPYL